MPTKIIQYRIVTITEELRNSTPDTYPNTIYSIDDDAITKQSLFTQSKKSKTITQRINTALLRYREVRCIYNKIPIPPVYILYVLMMVLACIFIRFLDDYFSFIIATAYPLYSSIKTLQGKYIGEEKADGTFYTIEDNKEEIMHWLTYWIVYALFIDFESLFKELLRYVPLYFFGKIVFLIACFHPNYQLAGWIYKNVLRGLFTKYEEDIVDMSNNIIKTLTLNTDKEQSLIRLKKNRSKENMRYHSSASMTSNESTGLYNNPFETWAQWKLRKKGSGQSNKRYDDDYNHQDKNEVDVGPHYR